MKIGIDLDDTVFYTAKVMIKYGDIFQKEISGKAINKDNFGLIENRYYLNALYNWNQQTKIEFFYKYYKNILEECEMIPKANEIIQKLKEERNSIHFITARLMNVEGCDTKNITIKTLDNNNIPYDSLNLHISNKLAFCKEHDIEILIEDSFDTCKELVDNGISAILMTTKMNEKIDAKNVTRVNNWDEVYKEIKNIKKV